ncbi:MULTISPECIES: hypothetical protein [unclassified Flavobacterium]|uniref:hypothetical protein n=1 Tax=unclassified Flavobacterium TaxID=196869 RepID=UPI00057F40FA|nr:MULTISPECIES: hypothetical protein [unclassified Flavobacterium]KIA92688.1 hypothetical protein OA93_23080 [Flavobacterium sp. KMS]OUL62801.1 hypothetical protein B8T70_08100 [Flavobacterium sp. AJR]
MNNKIQKRSLLFSKITARKINDKASNKIKVKKKINQKSTNSNKHYWHDYYMISSHPINNKNDLFTEWENDLSLLRSFENTLN